MRKITILTALCCLFALLLGSCQTLSLWEQVQAERGSSVLEVSREAKSEPESSASSHSSEASTAENPRPQASKPSGATHSFQGSSASPNAADKDDDLLPVERFEGSWYGEYEDPTGLIIGHRLEIGLFDIHEKDEDWYETPLYQLIYTSDNYPEMPEHVEGYLEFAIPEYGGYDDLDDGSKEIMWVSFIYNSDEAWGPVSTSLFAYSFLDADTLAIRHKALDPLSPGEEGFYYEFGRTYG